jgi:hypothetical protein
MHATPHADRIHLRCWAYLRSMHATTRVSLPHLDLVHLVQPRSDEFAIEHGHSISSLSFVSSSAQYLMIAPRTPTTSSTAHTPGSTSAFKSHRKHVENGQRRPHMPGPAASMMLTCSPSSAGQCTHTPHGPRLASPCSPSRRHDVAATFRQSNVASARRRCCCRRRAHEGANHP